MQEDNAADVVQSNGIKGIIVCICWNNIYVIRESKRKIKFCSFFQTFQNGGF